MKINDKTIGALNEIAWLHNLILREFDHSAQDLCIDDVFLTYHSVNDKILAVFKVENQISDPVERSVEKTNIIRAVKEAIYAWFETIDWNFDHLAAPEDLIDMEIHPDNRWVKFRIWYGKKQRATKADGHSQYQIEFTGIKEGEPDGIH